MKNTKKNKTKSNSTTSSGGIQYPPFSLNHLFLNGFIRDVGQLSDNVMAALREGMKNGFVVWRTEKSGDNINIIYYPVVKNTF